MEPIEFEKYGDSRCPKCDSHDTDVVHFSMVKQASAKGDAEFICRDLLCLECAYKWERRDPV
jgi:hypothetical protein